ncbi:hypothetical protein [Pseudoalteromonas ruthenica]|uniref:hypothetical protein n=1 Tax=Pseudoalteromonas ruthenica TaxID=151081 RepID=UPI001BB20D15|nr:hypothetical protein [Pseudoalteromonas ruthenica]
MKDILIPIVFPDYKITVTTPRRDVDLLPWVQYDNFTTPSSTQSLSDLGHAGILLVKGTTGLTKYYEYGRYDYPENKGIVRRVPVPDAKTGSGGIDPQSLVPVLKRVSMVAGKIAEYKGFILKLSMFLMR